MIKNMFQLTELFGYYLASVTAAIPKRIIGETQDHNQNLALFVTQRWLLCMDNNVYARKAIINCNTQMLSRLFFREGSHDNKLTIIKAFNKKLSN